MAFDVLSPDGISIEGVAYATREAAESALKRWVNRFQWQGFYSTSRWERIPLAELPGRCRIVEVDPDEEDSDAFWVRYSRDTATQDE